MTSSLPFRKRPNGKRVETRTLSSIARPRLLKVYSTAAAALSPARSFKKYAPFSWPPSAALKEKDGTRFFVLIALSLIVTGEPLNAYSGRCRSILMPRRTASDIIPETIMRERSVATMR